VAGTPFRVRRALDAGGGVLRGLLRVSGTTRLTLFAPGSRAGVDIVVLADSSSSMSVDDLPAPEEVRWRPGRRGRPRLTRMEALKDALHAMIDARMLHGAGVGTRFALLRFDVATAPVFPPHEGMEEVGDAAAATRLRQAVTLL
ncbi:VWA domain-containing protein, partial [Streptomyces sp. SID11233]|nr:VWA domain-containing protein [Streptomyces sp. SID11233]